MVQLTEERAPAITSARVRVLALLVWAIALAVWVGSLGPPKQVHLAIFWLWLATIAWNVRAPMRVHLAFIRDWAPAVAVLTLYLFGRGLSDDLGIVSVHVTEPITADRWLFGGTLPTAYLQEHLCGVPCSRTSQPAWYDVVLTTVYVSHFFVGLAVAVVLWLRDRAEWLRYIVRYLSLNLVALVIYVLYPMAPPWMAAQQGHVPDTVERITARGWYDLNPVGTWHQRFSAVGNQVAAMPSLHAAIAIFVAVYLISRWRSPWRWALLLYPAAMSFMLVYYAEHYVVDIIAGGLAVAVVWWGCAAAERWWARRRQRVAA
ncbi:phosphatase PAP2 family protein [Nocardioides jishulii]|uniref:Inositol phosphorylceramide synthase n=1 Tax=Nocardioides jishulii TaxID=2575440 RepID=A0A4U2YS97_9ACTN|nr:phosphatase PAP2 family protein [Nocardioides jishulii]QCX28767.1 inositol phosphorylceramide synthase [Nocardioides jishulii]TKI64337.1 inositol phosphorylceramide synthase [Nocardioides jishulii]